MKKYLVLTLVLFVSACANGPIYGDEDCTYHHEPRKNYRVQEVRPQPAPVVHVAQPQVVAGMGSGLKHVYFLLLCSVIP